MKNREILFKALYKGKWYQPALVGGTQVPQVFNSNIDLVNLCVDTEDYHVCEYSGINDTGNPDLKIFEDDIVLVRDYDYRDGWYTHIGLVVFDTGCFRVKIPNSTKPMSVLAFYKEKYKIGNIHDNPELLEPTNEN